MCFTGGFALAMMTEPAVIAPVLSQPSMPVIGGRNGSIDASAAEIACARRRFIDEDLTLLGLRYKSDAMVPDARFERYAQEFGDRFERIDLEDGDARPDTGLAPHSFLTIHLPADGPGKAAEARTIGFFRHRLGLEIDPVIADLPPAIVIPAAAVAPVVMPGGTRITDSKIGTGAEALPGQMVAVHYTGWLWQDGTRGKKFDSSLDRGQPFVFQLGTGQVIQGWDEGFAGMKIGGKRTLIVPPAAGYGAQGAGGDIPPNSTLIFEVELLAVQ